MGHTRKIFAWTISLILSFESKPRRMNSRRGTPGEKGVWGELDSTGHGRDHPIKYSAGADFHPPEVKYQKEVGNFESVFLLPTFVCRSF